MVLKIKHFVLIVTIGCFFSCRQSPEVLTKIEGKELVIDSSFTDVDSLETYIAPYRNRINEVLDSALAYAPKKISKDDGTYNTSAGNLLADIIRSEADPIFKARTGREIDFALLNHGGIRAIISQGKVTARNAFEVMPFENSIVIAELSGRSVRDLVAYLIKDKRPHPFSGMQIVLNPDGTLHSVQIQGKPLDENRKYNVATSNYLVTGGDRMNFFKDASKLTDTDYLIRNAIIDYLKKVDTLDPVVDDRFYILN